MCSQKTGNGISDEESDTASQEEKEKKVGADEACVIGGYVI